LVIDLAKVVAQFARLPARRVFSIGACGTTDTTPIAEERARRRLSPAGPPPSGSISMTRALGLALVAIVLGGASGCSIIDRLFLLNTDGPYGHHARHGQGGGCGPGGCPDEACADGGCVDGACADGACQACEGGVCKTPHAGRYGGLAKHHLSAAERAALEGSDYGATTPAGPPTGAVAYPYYTTRGPRDFLAKRPPSIGP
jgi:hypothetical protein